MVGLSRKQVFPKTKGDSITGQDRAQKHCDFRFSQIEKKSKVAVLQLERALHLTGEEELPRFPELTLGRLKKKVVSPILWFPPIDHFNMHGKGPAYSNCGTHQKYSDRERHAPCAIVPLKTEMSHRFLQWMRPGLFPIFTIIFGTK